MPLPVAHGLLGASVGAALIGQREKASPLILACAVIAIAPDLDLLTLFLGIRGAHRGFTHSFLSAAVVLLSSLFFCRRRAQGVGFAFAGAWLSHALLDFAASAKGGGVKLFWPATPRYKLGLVSFSEFPYGYRAAEVATAAIIEFLIFGLLLAVVWFARSARRDGEPPN